MSMFEEKNIAPMLIGADGDAFDDVNYLFEIKWDGERCIAYLDPKTGTELRNKRNVKMLAKVPELSEIHKQVTKRCILDGELMVLKDGKPDFFEIQRRSLMSNRFRIELAAKQYPATFIAYDILYLDGKDVTLQPLEQRKALLQKTVRQNERLAISKTIEGQGKSAVQVRGTTTAGGRRRQAEGQRVYPGKTDQGLGENQSAWRTMTSLSVGISKRRTT